MLEWINASFLWSSVVDSTEPRQSCIVTEKNLMQLKEWKTNCPIFTQSRPDKQKILTVKNKPIERQENV